MSASGGSDLRQGNHGERLFVAWLPDAAARDALAAAAASWRASGDVPGLRWVAPANLHLTLRFLGACTAMQRDGMDAGLAALAARRAPCTARTAGCAAWPSARAPRVLVLELAAHPALAELAAACETLARDCGHAAEPRRFRPHVTLARVRPGTILPSAPPAVPAIACRVDALALVRSTPGPDGSVYEPLARFPLATP